MNAPAYILGAAMIFRGWLVGPLVVAIVIGLVLEAPRFMSWRLEVTRRQFSLVWNICVALFIGLAAFFIATAPAKAVADMIRWAPFTLLPMMAAIAYSTAGKVDLDILSVIARNRVRREGEAGRTGVTLAYPFLVLCILSASASNERSPWFYAGCVVFLAWALWGVRPRSASLLPWLALIVLAGALGYAGHVGLHALHGKVEQAFTDWYARDRNDDGEVDPRRSAIGGMGSRKLSNRIKLRVELAGKIDTPVLLREAVYTTFRAQQWNAGQPLEQPVQAAGGGSWRVGTGLSTGEMMTIHASLGEGARVLPLPLGASRIEGLPAASLSRSHLGTVKVEDGPDRADYRVFNDPGSRMLDKATDKDLAVPDSEAAVLRKIAAELGLSSAEPAKAMQILSGYFSGRFRYSLGHASGRGDLTLSQFLLSQRAGHCEYFATATVLLMRAAGIPARYAVGYSVQEYSELEKMYIARARHAHAWALVSVDGAWRDLDTTPASWAAAENTRSPVIGYVQDLWQRLVFLTFRWLSGIGSGSFRAASAVSLGGIMLYLAWKLYKGRRLRGGGTAAGPKARPLPGRDSEFYAVEERLKERGFLRQPWESTGSWLENVLQGNILAVEQCDLLRQVYALHDRYRFDPEGISPEERASLRRSAQMWLELERSDGISKKH